MVAGDFCGDRQINIRMQLIIVYDFHMHTD